MMLIQHSDNFDCLFNAQSRVLQADWFILEFDEKATFNINIPYYRGDVHEILKQYYPQVVRKISNQKVATMEKNYSDSYLLC